MIGNQTTKGFKRVIDSMQDSEMCTGSISGQTKFRINWKFRVAKWAVIIAIVAGLLFGLFYIVGNKFTLVQKDAKSAVSGDGGVSIHAGSNNQNQTINVQQTTIITNASFNLFNSLSQMDSFCFAYRQSEEFKRSMVECLEKQTLSGLTTSVEKAARSQLDGDYEKMAYWSAKGIENSKAPVNYCKIEQKRLSRPYSASLVSNCLLYSASACAAGDLPEVTNCICETLAVSDPMETGVLTDKLARTVAAIDNKLPIDRKFYSVIQEGDSTQTGLRERANVYDVIAQGDWKLASHKECVAALDSQDSSACELSNASRFHGEDVPEPTGGLLLIVGCGMLGLRRKRSSAF